MPKALRVGVVGTGFIGEQHAGRLMKLPDISVAAICDSNLEAAKKLQDKLGLADCKLYSSFKAMLDDEKLDIVYFCIPPFAHNGEVELAAQKGIHVFLEKPIALTVERAESMVDAIEKAGVVSQVGFHYRFHPSVQKLKKMIDDGTAGKTTMFQARYWTNGIGSPWWRDVSRSGGQIFEQIIHMYDLGMYLMGKSELANGFMKNICHTAIADYSVEDTSVGMIRYAHGGVGVITGSNCALPIHFIGDFRVVCEKVMLDYRCSGQTWVKSDEATIAYHKGDDVTREEYVEDADVYKAETENFLKAVREGTPALTPARCGLDAIRLVKAVIRSSEQDGAPVDLSEEMANA